MNAGADTSHDDVISLMASVVRQANGLISDRLNEAGIGDLAPTHGDVLAVLYSEGEAKMCTIAERVGRDPSTITALVRKLQRLGYVEVFRDEKDRRVSKVRLTESGKQFRPLFESITDELGTIQSKAFSEQEREQMKSMLIRMRDVYCEERNRK